jgi:hypothetical protein
VAVRYDFDVSAFAVVTVPTRPAPPPLQGEPLSSPSTKDNLDLAESARDLADRAPAGSLEKAAAGSVAVTCATTRDVDHARTVLTGVVPDDVRRAAIELFERLVSDHP